MRSFSFKKKKNNNNTGSKEGNSEKQRGSEKERVSFRKKKTGEKIHFGLRSVAEGNNGGAPFGELQATK